MQVISPPNFAKNDFISLGLTAADSPSVPDKVPIELRVGFTSIRANTASVGIDFASVHGRLQECETIALEEPLKGFKYKLTVVQSSQRQSSTDRSGEVAAHGTGVAPKLRIGTSKGRASSENVTTESTVKASTFAEKQFGSQFEWHYRPAGTRLLDGLERTRVHIKRDSGASRAGGTISADISRYLRVLDSRGNDVGRLVRWIVLSRTQRDYRVHDVMLEFQL